MKSKNLPPYAPILIESTRAIGYSLEAAIADIIDNSITAKANNIDINFLPFENPYIAILDDGLGMSEDEIDLAMQYGSRNPREVRDTNDLGRYGLGLKTASLSQGKCLSVVSKKENKISARRWDIDYINETGEWSLLVLEEKETEDLPEYSRLLAKSAGTLIVWQKLDRLSIGDKDFSHSIGQKMDRVREHISLVFHRFLSGEPGLPKLNININNNPVEPLDPFLIKKSTQLMDNEVIDVRGEKIIVKPFILPHVSKLTESEIKKLGGAEGLRKQQGFYVYRNKRLLIWGTWFRLMRKGDLSKLARVQVDIPNSLDDLWTLDIKKSVALPPEVVQKNLANIIVKIAEGSKRTWTHRGKKEFGDEKIHLWNRLRTRDGIRYEINKDYPLVERLKNYGPEVKRILEMLLNQIESNIPLNSLYIDLTEDEKITNDVNISDEVAYDMIKVILQECSTDEERKTVLERLKNSEPFTEHIKFIEEKNGGFYGK